MNIVTKIILVFLYLILISCEEVGIIEEDLPFEELIVVNSQFSQGEINPQVRITKSLPLNSNYDSELANVTNALIYVRSADYLTYSYSHTGDGIYMPYDEFEVQNAQTYELFINIDGNKIYAISKAPAEPNVVRAELKDEQIEIEIIPNSNEVYCAAYVVTGVSIHELPIEKLIENDFFNVVGPFNESAESIIVKTGIVPNELRNDTFDGKLGVKVFAWDKSFKDYFQTKDNNKPIEDLFSQGGGSIKWNVIGDNTIGLFLGYSTLLIPDIRN